MDGQENARQLISQIIYLASLVSEPQASDAMLSKLRAVVSQAPDPTELDVHALLSIRAELEDYLVNKERVRTFNRISLRLNMGRHFAAKNSQGDIKKAALGQIGSVILVCCGITGFLVAFKLMEGQVTLAFLICTLFIGLAIIFQSIKKDLVAQLHNSVNYLIAATVGTGLFAINFPVIAASSYLEALPIFQHGGFVAAALPVYVFYYMASYLYAKQLNVTIPWLLRPIGAGVSAIVIAIALAVVPHPMPVSNEAFFGLALVGLGVSVYFSVISAILWLKSVAKSTAVYSKNILFLAISLALQSVGNGNLALFVIYTSGNFSVNEQKGQILTALFIVMALAFQYVAAYKSKTALR